MSTRHADAFQAIRRERDDVIAALAKVSSGKKRRSDSRLQVSRPIPIAERDSRSSAQGHAHMPLWPCAVETTAPSETWRCRCWMIRRSIGMPEVDREARGRYPVRKSTLAEQDEDADLENTTAASLAPTLRSPRVNGIKST